MEIHNNMAEAIQAYKELTGKSFSECAAEFDVSLTSIKEYAAGRGNPSVETIERMASRMGIDVAFFISGAYSKNQLTVLKKLLDMLGLLKELSPMNRVKFVEMLDIMVVLLNGGDTSA